MASAIPGRCRAASVTDLRDGLKAAGTKPPYILVGHSLGGFDARLLAYRYTFEVAGLLLIEPPNETIYQRTREPDEDLAGLQHSIDLVSKHNDASIPAWGRNGQRPRRRTRPRPKTNAPTSRR